MLESLEGTVPALYLDPAGLCTIGVGHCLTKSELTSGKVWIAGAPVRWAPGLTPFQITGLLQEDVERTEIVVTNAVRMALAQPQFDALCSFTFNCGESAFEHSTLLRLLNTGDYTSVPTQLRRWIYAKGQRLPVLEQRREVEIARWEATV